MWTLCGLIISPFFYDLNGPFPFGVIFKAVHALACLPMSVWIIFTMRKSWVRAVISVLVVASLSLGFFFLVGRFGRLARFYVMKSWYQEVIRDVAAGKIKIGENENDIFNDGPYIIDAGPPVRVIFPLPGRFLDNWCGVIYDLSGNVMRFGERDNKYDDQQEPELRDLQWIFGDKLFDAELLQDDWYFCWFT